MSADESEIEASRAPLLEHLVELPRRLIICAAALVVGFLACFAFSREIYIEQDDFREIPPPKYYRLSPGKEVRLRNAYFITAQSVVFSAVTLLFLDSSSRSRRDTDVLLYMPSRGID